MEKLVQKKIVLQKGFEPIVANEKKNNLPPLSNINVKNTLTLNRADKYHYYFEAKN